MERALDYIHSGAYAFLESDFRVSGIPGRKFSDRNGENRFKGYGVT